VKDKVNALSPDPRIKALIFGRLEQEIGGDMNESRRYLEVCYEPATVVYSNIVFINIQELGRDQNNKNAVMLSNHLLGRSHEMDEKGNKDGSYFLVLLFLLLTLLNLLY